jgi:hypothetical protein
LLDVGASDGITTLETVELLRDRLGGDVQATLLDQYTSFVRIRRTFLREYRTRDGSPIMLRLGPLALRLNDSTAVQSLARRFYRACTRFRHDSSHCQTVSLVNPLVASDPAIEVVEGDLLVPQPQLVGRFELVRAANVLSALAFTRDEISRAIAHLHNYLRDGGLLLVTRNPHEADPQTERGSLWRKAGERLERLEDFGGGSEIAEIVSNYSAAT